MCQPPGGCAVPAASILEDMEQPAWRGNGVLGWLRRRAGKGASIPAAMVEELFGPHRHRARETVQEQRQAAAPVPAPGEPADDT